MSTSSNVHVQNTSHPFESLDIDINPDFDPWEAASTGTKNADGSFTVKQEKVEERVEDKTGQTQAGKKETFVNTEENEDALDEFINNALLGEKTDVGVEDKPEGNQENKTDATKKEPVKTEGLNHIQAYYDLMVEKGLWKPVEGFDGTEESLEKVITQNHEQAIEDDVNSFIEDAFEKNPDGKALGKALLNHLANFGRISDFQAVYAQDDISVEDLDSEDKVTAENTAAAMLHQMYGDKMKPERLATFIAEKKKKGLLIDAAKDIAPDFENLRVENKKALEDETREQKQKAVLNAKNFQNSIITATQQEKIGEFVIGKTPQERKQLSDYILQPSVDIGNDKKTSGFYADLAEVKKDPNWTVVLAATVRQFKNKTATGKKDVTEKTPVKQTITQILEKNKQSAHSASSENSDLNTGNASTKKAWAGLL